MHFRDELLPYCYRQRFYSKRLESPSHIESLCTSIALGDGELNEQQLRLGFRIGQDAPQQFISDASLSMSEWNVHSEERAFVAGLLSSFYRNSSDTEQILTLKRSEHYIVSIRPTIRWKEHLGESVRAVTTSDWIVRQHSVEFFFGALCRFNGTPCELRDYFDSDSLLLVTT